jgi:serine protease
VLDQENRYDDALVVAKGVRWAVDRGAKVINLSLGGSGNSAALAAALDYAFARDVVVVACTGNANAAPSAGVWYPAREPGVVAVAGMERDGDVLWSGSITGKETVVTAPATQLVGARPSGYWRVQGTSFAAPMVSGTAALIRSRWPSMPAGEVINRIIKTAKDRGAPGRDSTYGYGMIDPTGALTAQVPEVLDNPLDTTPDPGVARLGSAPSAGQALSAPDSAQTGAVKARVPGENAGSIVAAGVMHPASTRHGWWVGGALFLLSVVAALLTLRRFGRHPYDRCRPWPYSPPPLRSARSRWWGRRPRPRRSLRGPGRSAPPAGRPSFRCGPAREWCTSAASRRSRRRCPVR